MTNILVNDFIIVIMMFLRIASAFLSSPVLGHRAIPILVKMFLSFLIALIIFLTVKSHPAIINFDIWNLSAMAVKEIISGLMLGFMLHLVFYGISYAGTLMGFDIGIAVAEMFNPMDETNTNIIGEIIYVAAVVLFFLINGHHYVIQALVYSFTIIPVGKYTINASVYSLIVQYSGQVFIIAVKIAAPIMVSFFLVHIAEGILARVIPQMQVFFVTQPLKIGLGLLLLALSVPVYVYAIKGLLREFQNNLYSLIQAMGS